jgi:hypothetical protein
MTKWEQACDFINPLITAKVDENTYQKIFEAILKNFLSWDKKTMQRQAPSQHGRETKRVDIVLNGDGFGIVVEMKKPGEKLDDYAKGQLVSYMRNLVHKYGLLVGDHIKAFYDENGVTNETGSFDFNSANPDGTALFEILDRNVCSGERFKEFVLEREKKQTVPPPPPPPGKFDLDDLITTYNRMDDTKYRIEGRKRPSGRRYYIHINIPGWPQDEIFYEFNTGENGVEVMFHIYGNYPKLTKFIEKYNGIVIENYPVEYQTPPPRRYGRLVIQIPCDKGYEKISKCMLGLISRTKEEIDEFKRTNAGFC